MNSNKKRLAMLMCVGLCAVGLNANAVPVPTTTTFAGLPGATFGGSGIYNDAVLITKMTFPGASAQTADTITVGLATTPRGVGPELVNNGVNTFYADPGAGAPGRAKWNMDFDVSSSLNSLVGYTLTLIYGKEGGASSTLNLVTSFPDSTGAPGSWQNSENLTFSQFSGIGFDLSATGIYDFAIQVQKGDFIGTSGTMHVNVGNVPDGCNTMLLLGSSFALMGFAYVKKDKWAGSVASAA